MIKIAGIISEYNPFHNGHQWQIKKIKELLGAETALIAVMSGNFTQRGCPALLNKWLRAEMAVAGGIDLVFELPFLAACKSAEYFATGAVRVLNACQLVTHLCFGSEEKDLALLLGVAEKISQKGFSQQLKTMLKTGLSYPAAIEQALRQAMPNLPGSFFQPNNILALEYLKALKKTGSSLQPLAIQRTAAGHLDEDIVAPIASATAIRKELRAFSLSEKVRQSLPSSSFEILQKAWQQKEVWQDKKIWESLLLFRLRSLTAGQIASLADISEGLENLLKKAGQEATSIEQLLQIASSRRYPQTRLWRIFSQLLVREENQKEAEFVPYLRILAFNERGRALIKKIRPVAAFPLITNLPDFIFKSENPALLQSLALDARATDIYQLLLGKNTSGLDFREKPRYLKSI